MIVLFFLWQCGTIYQSRCLHCTFILLPFVALRPAEKCNKNVCFLLKLFSCQNDIYYILCYKAKNLQAFIQTFIACLDDYVLGNAGCIHKLDLLQKCEYTDIFLFRSRAVIKASTISSINVLLVMENVICWTGSTPYKYV